MADIRLAAVIRYLHRLAGPSAIEGQSDAVLLGRLAAQHDPAAFETLLRRHGPLVWRVCRRVLHHEQDAEDAFQATFLALARQVKSIRKPESLTSFLHGTAYRIARRLQEDDRRRSAAREIPPAPVSDPSQEASWRELGRIVEEEVHALPEKIRAALLLCYWEGLTNEEAARRLGCPCGTLKARLAKARKLLHARLTRRGVKLPAGAIALLLAPGGGEAAVPPTLAMRTASMAEVSPRVAVLVEGGLQSMTLSRVKIGLVLLALGTAASGIGVLAHRAPVAAEKEDRDAQTQPAKERPTARTDLHGDPLPERALARLGTVRWRMSGLFFACAYSPDGKTLAAASADHHVYLFDAATGKLIGRLGGHPSEVTSIAYSLDGRTLASGCAKEGTIRIWEPATGKLLRQFHAPRWPVWSLIFSRDGKKLLSGGGWQDSPILLWDPTSGKQIRQFDGPKEGARSLALSPDGRTVASNSKGEVQLWEMDTGKLIRSLTGQKKRVRALAFSPDGKLLASGSEDCSVWLWETATGKVQRRLPDDPEELQKLRDGYVRALAFSPDGKTLVVGSGDHSLRFWDVATGKKLREMPGVGSVTYAAEGHDGGIQCLVFSPDGRRLAFGQDNRLALLDTQSGEEVLRFEGHRGDVQKVFFGPDGKRLITVSNDPERHILEWDSTAGRLIRHILGKIGWANQLSFSPDRTIMALVDGATLRLKDIKTGKEIRQFTLPLKKASTIPNEVVFSPDGKWLAVVEGLGQSAWLLDAATGKQVWSGRGTSNWTFALARFSADNRLLALVGNEAIQFVEVSSGRQLLYISLPKNRTTFAAALSPDGRTLALASGAWTETPTSKGISYPGGGSSGIALGSVLKVRAITLWETATGKERRTLPSPCDRVNSLTFSPDGQLLVAGGNDHMVHFCDTATGKWMKRLEGHQGEVMTLVFASDGRRVASGSRDTTALIWDVTGLATRKRRSDPLPRKELDTLWSTLAAADAAKAYQAILMLETLPEQAVPLLAEHLHRRSAPDAERIAGLVKQLDSEDFAARQRAAAELRKLGWTAEPALLKALEDKPSLEMRKRAKELLDEIFKTEPSPPWLQHLRAVEVLERIGTSEAKEILRELATRAPETRLTREANASLDRLARP
jgi:RNA polymerase sigma factor (sigma-70 family)